MNNLLRGRYLKELLGDTPATVATLPNKVHYQGVYNRDEFAKNREVVLAQMGKDFSVALGRFLIALGRPVKIGEIILTSRPYIKDPDEFVVYEMRVDIVEINEPLPQTKRMWYTRRRKETSKCQPKRFSKN